MPTTQIKLDKPMPLPAKRERKAPMPIQTESNVPNPNLMPTTQYLIESNVPMPAPKGRYPFKLLGIGDSFVIPIAEVSRATEAAHSCWQAGDTKRRRFTRRQDKASGTVRFWRVS